MNKRVNKRLSKKTVIIAVLIVLVVFFAVLIPNYKGVINISRETASRFCQKVPVLGYHGFVPSEVKERLYGENRWIDDIEGFEEQMKYLHDNGWHTLTLDEFYNWQQNGGEIPEKSCLITFDDGYYEMYYEVYPILKKYGFNAVCFVVGSFTSETTPAYNESQRHMIGWDKIEEIRREYPGFEFESHSYNLHGFDEEGKEPWINATQKELSDDAAKMKEKGFSYTAYPYGGFNRKMKKAMEDNNFKMAFTFKREAYATKIYPKYEIPRLKISAIVSYEEFVSIMEKA